MGDKMEKAEVIRAIGAILLDEKRPMKERYRALFTLRNLGGRESIDEISRCFSDQSALLKHECAYCLGQVRGFCKFRENFSGRARRSRGGLRFVESSLRPRRWRAGTPLTRPYIVT